MKTSSAMIAGYRGLKDDRTYKLTLTGLFAALSYVVFTFLQIKITPLGGDAISIHLGNAVCVLGVLISGGFYGGLGGALEMITGDLFDPIYAVYALKILLLELCISPITDLVAHKIGRINEGSDKRYVPRFAMVASICGLLLNVMLDPLVRHFYKLAILGRPAVDLAPARNITSTSINVMTSVTATVVIHMSFRSILIGPGLFDRFRWQEI